jgi:hypothetical protein
MTQTIKTWQVQVHVVPFLDLDPDANPTKNPKLAIAWTKTRGRQEPKVRIPNLVPNTNIKLMVANQIDWTLSNCIIKVFDNGLKSPFNGVI